MKEVTSKTVQSTQDIKQVQETPTQQKKQDLVTYVLANMLHETVQKHLAASTSAVSKPGLGAAPKAGLGAEPPFPPLPPDTPPSPYDSSVPQKERQILEKIDAFIESIYHNPANPATLEKFIAFLTNLSKRPGGITSAESKLLDQAGIAKLLGPKMQTFIMLEFFEKGAAAGQHLKDELENFLHGLPQNKYTQSMLNGLYNFNYPQFAVDHAGGKWTIFGYDMNWGDPEGKKSILSLIFNMGPKQKAPDSYFDGLNINKFSRQYRLMQIDDMIAAAKGNPDKLMILLSLWFMKDADDRIQRQEQGLASTTNRLSNMTNDYMTPILNKIKAIGPNFTDKDAKELTNLYINATIRMNTEGQLSSLADGWNKNTVGAINSIMVPDPRYPKGQKVSLGSLFQAEKNGKISTKVLTDALKSLVPTPPSGGSPGPSTSPAYQALITAMQSGGGLVTGMSKTTSTQLSALANVDNAVIKFGHTIADSTGGGIAQLMTKLVGNQISR